MSHGREVWALKEMENRIEWAHEVINLRNTIAMKHVLHMHSYFELNEMYYIVMEYFEAGDMENAIINLGFRKRKITVDKTCIALKWIFDAMKGLKEMHDENMAHNDIKAQNIIVEDDTTAVIGDLGLADIFTEKQISDAKASKEILAPGGGTILYLRTYFLFGVTLIISLHNTHIHSNYYAHLRNSLESQLLKGIFTILCPQRICGHLEKPSRKMYYTLGFQRVD